jgi:fumarate hydratase subunit alpha
MNLVDLIANTLVSAGSTFSNDKKEAYCCAIAKEQNQVSRWIMEQILDNSAAAEKNRSPLCDDTGIPHIFIEIGKNRSLTGEMMEEIQEGVRKGLTLLPGRPMAVIGNDLQRLAQSEGMSMDPADLEPAPVLIKNVEDDDMLRVHVLMLGGGPAIRGITHRVFHRHSWEVVRDTIVERAKEVAGDLGCTPATLCVGIGRSQFEATALMMQAMVYGDHTKQNDLETYITNAINETQVGPLGLGGDTTILSTFVKVGPQRASGVRVVAMRPCCCFEPRKAYVDL